MAKRSTVSAADPLLPRGIDDLNADELSIVLVEIARAYAAKHGRVAALHALGAAAEALADGPEKS